MSTDFVDINVHDGSQHTDAFWRLFQFISGENSESVEIPMTAPVTYRLSQNTTNVNVINSTDF